jgi:hypothetical protein
VIVNSEEPDLLRAFWHAIVGRIPERSNERFENGISILDPTCGSGAFLFAALNVLEPLYDACLDRMQVFLDDLERSGGKYDPKKYGDFRSVVKRVDAHPNHRYFVLKSIIINNLFGVDIMEEAVEICKLRLFLKLVAQVEHGEQIEPLPDIDFNIRAGNSLVGYATYAEAKRAVTSKLDFENAMARIEERAEDIDRLSDLFRQQQTEGGGEIAPADKQELRMRLKALEDELNVYLAGEYGIDPNKKERFLSWLRSYKPFHWFIEFHRVMGAGGFDVVIGNPPWKEYAAVKRDYIVRGYKTESCGNMHGLCTERAIHLRGTQGLASFIVQLPLASSSRMSSVRETLTDESASVFVIPFDDRPGKLFEGLQHCRSVIFIGKSHSNGAASQLSVARYQRWPSEARSELFSQLMCVTLLEEPARGAVFPKYGGALDLAVFRKLQSFHDQTVGRVLSRGRTDYFIFYQEATQYWVKATVGLPFYSKNGTVGGAPHGRYVYFDEEETAHAVCALMNSSLFYTYFVAYGDCFHLSDSLVTAFPFDRRLLESRHIAGLGRRLMADLRSNADRKTITTSSGDSICYDEFNSSRSKPIIDEVDHLLGRYYGFTDDELDFVINYDIKYRIGRDRQEGGE